MLKACALLMLLANCKVHSSAIPGNSYKEITSSSSDVESDEVSKANYTIMNASNCVEIQRRKVIDCADLFHMGHNKSGVYEIWPINRLTERKYINVYCDMDTNGGGWTVIQRRGDFKRPKDYFYRDWQNYKEGFGDIEQDFWLGNDNIYALTNQKLYSVRFDLKDVDQNKRYALYDKFWINDEDHKYTLHISVYTGDAGDSMKRHNKQAFSTFDRNNGNTCAESYKGAWWYESCHDSNLNGLYYKGKNGNVKADGTSWRLWKGDHESLEWTEIKIRPKHFRATVT